MSKFEKSYFFDIFSYVECGQQCRNVSETQIKPKLVSIYFQTLSVQRSFVFFYLTETEHRFSSLNVANVAINKELIIFKSSVLKTTMLLTAILAVLSFLPASFAICENDPNFIIPYNGKPHDCVKIRYNEIKRQSLCTVAEVVAACPQACGICCQDNPIYTFGLAWDNNVIQDCAWILKGKVSTSLNVFCILFKMEDTIQ